MQAAERQKPPAGELFLDHVGHFVPDLGAAGALLEEVGFHATPVSHHEIGGKPGGTSNRCVMLEQGYLEILAPTLDTPNGRRVRAHMARYSGVHLACYGTPSAEAEHARLVAHGFAPEPLVNLQRRDADGNSLKFNVVYVSQEKMPEGRIQYCEHLTPQFLWNARALKHRNGVKGLGAVYVVADDPADTAARWARHAGLLPRAEDDMVRFDTARGRIYIGARKARAGFIRNLPPAPAIAAVSLLAEEPADFAARCVRAGFHVEKTSRGPSVSLPPALGGTWLVDQSLK
jgi:hypothetical protein